MILYVIHNDLYDYSLVKYSSYKTKVDIICRKHGVFQQYPQEHLQKCGCPKCKNSFGEIYIVNFLEEKNISYHPQFKFDNCTNIK